MKQDNLKEFEREARKVMNEAITLLVNKHRDYGDNALRGGQLGIVVRLSDKMARLENLTGVADGTFKQKDAIIGDEQISDTIRDIINYGVLFLMEGNKK